MTSFQPGDRIQLETVSSQVFEGTVEAQNCKSLEIYNVSCRNTDFSYEGTLTFYHTECVKTVLISALQSTKKSAPKILMDPDEYHRLQKMTYDFIYISGFGKSFDDAVTILNDRESVAVVGLGSGRINPLSLLLMADFQQIFIFDMHCLVKLGDLQDILESEYISKVVHDGAALYHCLYDVYKVQMRNVFDTKVVDAKIFLENENKRVSRNISECLTYHFNFLPSLLSAALGEMDEISWLERPLVKGTKIRAAQLVVYLLSLRDKLLRIILKSYTSEIETDYMKSRKSIDRELFKES